MNRKEAEELKFDAWPDASKFRRWKMQFRREVAAKSGRPQEALKWIGDIETVESVIDLISSKFGCHSL